MFTSAQHRVHRLAWVTLWYNIGDSLGALVRAMVLVQDVARIGQTVMEK